MLGYYPVSIRNLMSVVELEDRGHHAREVVDRIDITVAQAKAREWLDDGNAGLRWRADALSLALSGLVPALGFALFAWSPRAIFAAFCVDLAAASFWDIARMLLAKPASESELHRVLGVERALAIARAGLARRGGARAIAIRREPRLEAPVARFALGYGVMAFATLSVLAIPVIYLLRDLRYGIWPQPLWLVLAPIVVRSVFALADVRAAASGRPRPQVLPQAVSQNFSVLLALVAPWGLSWVLLKLGLPIPDLSASTTYLAAYAVAATTTALLLAAQVRSARSAFEWLVSREPEVLVPGKG